MSEQTNKLLDSILKAVILILFIAPFLGIRFLEIFPEQLFYGSLFLFIGIFIEYKAPSLNKIDIGDFKGAGFIKKLANFHLSFMRFGAMIAIACGISQLFAYFFSK